MIKKSIKSISFVMALTLMIGTAGCTGGNKQVTPEAEKPAAQAPVDGVAAVGDNMESIVRFGRDWPTYIDPGVGRSYTCQISHANLYDALVYPTVDGGVEPHLAAEWDVSPDNLTYTFKIRDDVKFHSGNIIKASDVAFSMNRLLTVGEGFSYLYKGTVAECYTTDDTTVVMKLANPFGPFVSTLTRFYVLEEAVVMANIDKTVNTYGEFGDYAKQWLLYHDAGSGPYKVKEVKLEEYVQGERFDDYFLGWEENAPQYFMLSNMNDPVAQRTTFANKQLEISADSLPQETYMELEKMGAGIAKKSGTGGWNMLLNTKMAPTDDVNFRKALAYAFDYDTLTSQILPGNSPATGPVSSVLFGKNETLPGYKYDMEKAKEYLMQSKYANDPSAWVVDMAWCAEVPEQEKISLMFQASLQQLGITLNITKTPFSVMTSNAQTIETTPNASIVQWSPNYFEAGDVFKTRYHSLSVGSWEQMEWLQDSALDAMIDDALSTIDNGEREKKYKEIEAYIYELSPTIWMCRNDAKLAVQPYVDWKLLTYSLEGKPAFLPGGYDLYFRDMKVNLDKK